MGFKTDTLTAKNSGSSLTTNATSVDFNTNLKASVSGTDVTVDSIVDIVVTVASSKFVIDGVSQADIAISKGTTYRFDVSDSSNASHPFRLSATSAHGTEYTTGKTVSGTQGSSGAYVQYTTSQATPDSLYYYCTSHSGMGGNVHSGAVGGNITQLSDGKVGIGVTSPSKALDVDGQIKVRGASSTSKIFGSHASDHAIAIDGSSNVTIPQNITITGTTSLNGVTYTWPSSDASSSGYQLTSDGSGGLSWAAAGSGGGGSGISSVVADTAPQLGGDLDVNGNDIVSASGGDITITPNGTGNIILDGQKWPQADGSSGQYLKTDGSGQLSWGTVSGGGGGSSTVSLLGSSTSAITAGASAAIDATHTGDHTISTDNVIIPVNTSSSAVTITLYAASGNAGRIVCVKDVGGAAYTNNITIDANSSETIDGQTTQTISSNYGAVTMFCDGSNWFVI